jgi:hypothetical protein
VEVGEHEEVELACRVSNAKPRADVVWYRNNVEFDPGAGKASTITVLLSQWPN